MGSSSSSSSFAFSSLLRNISSYRVVSGAFICPCLVGFLGFTWKTLNLGSLWIFGEKWQVGSAFTLDSAMKVPYAGLETNLSQCIELARCNF